MIVNINKHTGSLIYRQANQQHAVNLCNPIASYSIDCHAWGMYTGCIAIHAMVFD